MRTPTNSQVAAALERVAELLDAQRASPFRVQAFRTGAACVRAMTRPVAEVLDTVGTEGLERLPGIGKTLAEAIRQLVRTGRYGMLSRLDGEVAPEDVLTTIRASARRWRAGSTRSWESRRWSSWMPPHAMDGWTG